MRALLLLCLIPFAVRAEDRPRASVNGTVSGRWLDEVQVGAGRERAALSGGGVSFGGTVELIARVSRFRLGGQLGLDALEGPRSDLEVGRSEPLVPFAPTREVVSAAMFITLSPCAGLAFGDEHLQGWLDLLVAFELLRAKVDGDWMLAATVAPTLRLGGAVMVGDVGLEVSLLGSYFGAARVTLAIGLRL
ncbi:MAG: hypothetical protein Q8L48_41590 [Archangium sp.]|nr:hypothetical protein [Archangium sp.]